MVKIVPLGGQNWNQCCDTYLLVTLYMNFLFNWICILFSWRDNSSYRVNTLRPLWLLQCFLFLPLLLLLPLLQQLLLLLLLLLIIFALPLSIVQLSRSQLFISSANLQDGSFSEVGLCLELNNGDFYDRGLAGKIYRMMISPKIPFSSSLGHPHRQAAVQVHWK